MTYMPSNKSDVLQEFGRIMQEKDELKKVAQVGRGGELAGKVLDPNVLSHTGQPKPAERPYIPAGPAGGFQVHQPAPKAANPALESYTNALLGLQTKAQNPNPQHDPKLLISRRELENLAQLGKAVNDIAIAEQASAPLLEYDAGRDPRPVLLGIKTHEQAATPPRANAAALSVREKVAEQKSYDVTGKEDMVHEAHPQTAKVEGEVIENLNEQQKADLAVAEKSAKSILVALYKLAKRLKAEKNTKAYSLVKETFLDLSKSFKK